MFCYDFGVNRYGLSVITILQRKTTLANRKLVHETFPKRGLLLKMNSPSVKRGKYFMLELFPLKAYPSNKFLEENREPFKRRGQD